MDDPSEHQDDVQDQPKQGRQRVMPKKKRRFVRTLNPSKKAAVDSSAAVEAPTEPRIISTRSAARKPTNAELSVELKRKHRELLEVNKELEIKNKQFVTLTRKSASFAEATQKARAALRQQKSDSKASDMAHKKMLRAVQEHAEDSINDVASHHKAQRQKEEVRLDLIKQLSFLLCLITCSSFHAGMS
jgi:hypothetical protein